MACGCRKSNSPPSRPAIRAGHTSSRIQPNISAQTTPPVSTGVTGPGMDTDRLRKERLRREAIKRALNK